MKRGPKMVRMEGPTLRTTALRDITERIEAEEALRTSEARLRALSDNFPNGLIYQTVRESDGAMRFLHVSAGVERIHGCDGGSGHAGCAGAVCADPRGGQGRLFAAEVRSLQR